MQKKKASFNIIDALIIVLVIAVFAVGYLVFFRDRGAVQEDSAKKIRYVFQVSSIPAEFADNAKVSQTVFDAGTNTPAGVITAVDFEPATHIGHDKINGKQTISQIDGYVNLYITMEGEAVEKKNTYVVDETSVYVGKYLDMMLPDLTCSGNCISLEVVE